MKKEELIIKLKELGARALALEEMSYPLKEEIEDLSRELIKESNPFVFCYTKDYGCWWRNRTIGQTSNRDLREGKFNSIEDLESEISRGGFVPLSELEPYKVPVTNYSTAFVYNGLLLGYNSGFNDHPCVCFSAVLFSDEKVIEEKEFTIENLPEDFFSYTYKEKITNLITRATKGFSNPLNWWQLLSLSLLGIPIITYSSYGVVPTIFSSLCVIIVLIAFCSSLEVGEEKSKDNPDYIIDCFNNLLEGKEEETAKLLDRLQKRKEEYYSLKKEVSGDEALESILKEAYQGLLEESTKIRAFLFSIGEFKDKLRAQKAELDSLREKKLKKEVAIKRVEAFADSSEELLAHAEEFRKQTEEEIKQCLNAVSSNFMYMIDYQKELERL